MIRLTTPKGDILVNEDRIIAVTPVEDDKGIVVLGESEVLIDPLGPIRVSVSIGMLEEMLNG